MADNASISTLRRLFAAEHACPTARLHQAMPYVPWSDAREENPLQRIAHEDEEHLQWLAQLLFERGTAPPPASYPTNSAAMHYVRLNTLMPRFVKAERELIATYQSLSKDLADDPAAARVAAQIAGRHTEHLNTFQKLGNHRT